MSRQPNPPSDEPQDLIDEAMSIPLVNAGVTRLQRVLGPSCFASLVILMLLAVLLRRWLHLPPIGMVAALIIIWMLTLGVLVRLRNDNPDGDLDSGEAIDRQK